MLLTCGCSFVWGDELKGFHKSPPEHWEYTFTHILAEKLNMGYANLAACGNGNDKIFRDTMNYLTDSDREQPTHMVILWSAWQRMEMAEHAGYEHHTRNIGRFDNMTQYSPERVHNVEPSKWGALYRYYNDAYDVRTDILRHLTYMITIQEICDLKGIKLIQGAFHNRLMENIGRCLQAKNDWKDWNKKFGDMLGKLRPECRVGLGHYETLRILSVKNDDVRPHGHPGEKSHAQYASLLHHIFNTIDQ